MAPRHAPVHQCAQDAGIPVFTPKSLKTPDDQRAFAAHQADVAVVIAYGLLLPAEVLNAPKHGCFNVHASKLPRWRGAAPIQRAIMAGDTTTAVAIMHMDEGLDTGPVSLSTDVTIAPGMTASQLHDELARVGADLIVEAMDRLEDGTLAETPQPAEGITYAQKILKSEARIDFNQDAQTVHNHIRGLAPFPGAWFELERNGKPERIKVLRSRVADEKGQPGEVTSPDGTRLVIACANRAVELVEIQRAGKKPVTATQFLRGFDLPQGTAVSNG